MAQIRQLAAIMFTDIVGYSALMEEDEQKAFDLLIKNRNIQKPIIEKYNGEWLKEMGDGVLASFSTVTEAVNCAKEIQQACLYESDLSLRIGIHQGEVIFDGKDVFGRGVNIASRIEPLAPAGGILVTEAVHNSILNKLDIESTFIQEKRLKNVKKPVKLYEVHVDGTDYSDASKSTVYPHQLSIRLSKPKKLALSVGALLVAVLLTYIIFSKVKDQPSSADQFPEYIDKSIAVLPFANISDDPNQEYFSDGMMEEILNHLVKIEDLQVTSRTSVMQYKKPHKLSAKLPKIWESLPY